MKIDDILTDAKIGNIHSEVIHLDEEGDPTLVTTISGDELPILPLRNMVLFPQVVMPVSIGRDSSLKLVREVYDRHGELLAVMQRDHIIENPKHNDLFTYGTVARILRIIELPDNTTMVILHGRRRARIVEAAKQRPYLTATIDLAPEVAPETVDEKAEQTLDVIKALCEKIVKKSNSIPNEVLFAVEHSDTPEALINFVCGNLQIDKFAQQELLETHDLRERATLLADVLTRYPVPVTLHKSWGSTACPGKNFPFTEILTPAKEEKEDDDMIYYHKLADIPAWGEPTVQRLIDVDALRGDETGDLNLSHDMLRILVILDRLGRL